MYCSKCGQQLPEDAAYCFTCGAPQGANVYAPHVEEKWEYCEVDFDCAYVLLRGDRCSVKAIVTGPSGRRIIASREGVRAKRRDMDTAIDSLITELTRARWEVLPSVQTRAFIAPSLPRFQRRVA